VAYTDRSDMPLKVYGVRGDESRNPGGGGGVVGGKNMGERQVPDKAKYTPRGESAIRRRKPMRRVSSGS